MAHLKCNFCDSPQYKAALLIKGRNAHICNECIEFSLKIMNDKKRNSTIPKLEEMPKPKELRHFLDGYVIGQERAKTSLAVAVYNHYKRIKFGDALDGVNVEKSNIALIGPTGSGKTYLAKTLARILHVPFVASDATALTEAGYIGDDVVNILQSLINAADGDIRKAEQGIVYIDEIDKIARKIGNGANTRDISGESVQQNLLKIIEGTVVNVPPQGGYKHSAHQFVQIDTTNILFVCSGAFTGLEDIIKKRLSKQATKQTELTSLEVDNYLPLVLPEDLQKFGLIPEFIGRLPVITTLDALNEEAFIDILTKPKNSLIKQYQAMLMVDGVKLDFTDQALYAIAKKAISRNTGARGLRTILEQIMLGVMYELPSRTDIATCIINEKCITENKSPTLETNDGRRIVNFTEIG